MMATIGGTSAQNENAMRLVDVMTPVPSQTSHSAPCEMPVPLHVVQVMDLAASSPSAAKAHTLKSETAITTSSKTAKSLRLEFMLKFLP